MTRKTRDNNPIAEEQQSCQANYVFYSDSHKPSTRLMDVTVVAESCSVNADVAIGVA